MLSPTLLCVPPKGYSPSHGILLFFQW
jgi:hypothetical protein